AADVASGLAARLDAGLNWDLVDITSDLVGKRPALQDSVLVDLGWKSTTRIALFRAGSFDAAATGAGELLARGGARARARWRRRGDARRRRRRLVPVQRADRPDRQGRVAEALR